MKKAFVVPKQEKNSEYGCQKNKGLILEEAF